MMHGPKNVKLLHVSALFNYLSSVTRSRYRTCFISVHATVRFVCFLKFRKFIEQNMFLHYENGGSRFLKHLHLRQPTRRHRPEDSKAHATVVRNSDVDRSAVALELRNSGVAECSLVQNNVTVLFPGS